MTDANSPEIEKITPDADFKKEDELPKIRTFKSDAGRYIEEHRPSLSSIAAERIDKGELSPERAPAKFFNAKRLIVFGGAGLFVVILAVAAASFFSSEGEPSETAIQPPQSLIAAEEEEIIQAKEGDRASVILAIQEVLASRHPRKSFLNLPIFITKQSGEKKFLETQEFFRTLEVPASPELLRTFGRQMLLGVFSGSETLSQKNNHLVLIFKIASYEDAFAGMLEWERSIVRDIGPLMPRSLNMDTANEIFRDQVIRNQDARYIINAAKDPILFYAIINRKVLLLATSQEALEEMTNRLILSFPK